MVHCGQSLGKSADVFAVMYVSTPLLIRLDLTSDLASHCICRLQTTPFLPEWQITSCDIFHTLTEMFVYKFLLGFYKIWDIIFYFILLGCTFAETG